MKPSGFIALLVSVRAVCGRSGSVTLSLPISRQESISVVFFVKRSIFRHTSKVFIFVYHKRKLRDFISVSRLASRRSKKRDFIHFQWYCTTNTVVIARIFHFFCFRAV